MINKYEQLNNGVSVYTSSLVDEYDVVCSHITYDWILSIIDEVESLKEANTKLKKDVDGLLDDIEELEVQMCAYR